jgi:hypothetical protein
MESRIVAAQAALALLLLQSGCGGGGSPSDVPAPDAAALTGQGWERFEAGDWSGARSSFRDAVQTDGAYGDGHNGLGWAALKLEAHAEARAAFETASTLGPTTTDPLAGLALLCRDFEPVDPVQVVDYVSRALARAPQYRFAHDRSLDWRDLRLLLAQAHFTLGAYASANEQVLLLGGLAADPQSESFVRDLLVEIERLGRLLNG